MNWAARDRLWSIPAGLAAIFCMICILPAMAVIFVCSVLVEKLTGETV